MKKSLILPLLISLSFIIPSVSSAQTPVACNLGSSPTIAQLQACIADLQAQIATIIAQQDQGFRDGARVEALVNLRVRQTPVTSGTVVTTIPRGTQGTIKTDCPSTNTPSTKGKCAADANGYTWWYIKWDSSSTGWSVEGTTEVDYIQPISGNQGNQTGNNTLRIKRAGADLYNLTTLQTSAWYDSNSPTSNNPADFKVSAGQHTAYTTNVSGYTIYAGTCTASDTTPNCSVNPSSITGHLAITPTCDQTKCSVPVQVTQNHAAKVVFEYVSTTSTQGQAMYYCHIPDYRVGQTLSQYTNTATCNSNLATYMPGQTTGTCYPTSAAASAACVAGVTIPPSPIVPTPLAEFFPDYDLVIGDGQTIDGTARTFTPLGSGTYSTYVDVLGPDNVGRELHAGGGVFLITSITNVGSHGTYGYMFGTVTSPFSKLRWPAGTWSVYTPGGATIPTPTSASNDFSNCHPVLKRPNDSTTAERGSWNGAGGDMPISVGLATVYSYNDSVGCPQAQNYSGAVTLTIQNMHIYRQAQTTVGDVKIAGVWDKNKQPMNTISADGKSFTMNVVNNDWSGYVRLTSPSNTRSLFAVTFTGEGVSDGLNHGLVSYHNVVPSQFGHNMGALGWFMPLYSGPGAALTSAPSGPVTVTSVVPTTIPRGTDITITGSGFAPSNWGASILPQNTFINPTASWDPNGSTLNYADVWSYGQGDYVTSYDDTHFVMHIPSDYWMQLDSNWLLQNPPILMQPAAGAYKLGFSISAAVNQLVDIILQ